MRHVLLTGILVAGVAVVAQLASFGGEPPTPLQGTWSIISGEKAGRAAPEKDARAMTVVITADSLTFSRGQQHESMKLKLDPAKTPSQIDLTTADGTVRPGIYQLAGDTLKICLSGTAERPKDFGATEGTRTSLMVLQRVKAQ